MAASTLSIGTSNYSLLEALDGATVSKSGKSYSIKSKEAIENLSINSEGLNDPTLLGQDSSSNINIFAGLENFQATLGNGGDSLNILGNVEGGRFELDDSSYSDIGADFLSIQGNLTKGSAVIDSQGDIGRTEINRIYAGGGNDTIRIAKNVEDAFIYLGSGNDSLTISGNSKRLDVKGDAGNDYIEFRGTAGDLFEGGVRVQAGENNDTVVFRDLFAGSSASEEYLSGEQFFGDRDGEISDPGTSAVDLGSGSDSLIIARGASNVDVNTGSGRDTVSLSGSYDNVRFHLDGLARDRGGNPTDQGFNTGGDRISSSNGGSFTNSVFTSNNTLGDTLIFGSGTLFDESQIYTSNNSQYLAAGLGNDSLVFGTANFNNSVLSTGYGADTIVFGANSVFNNLSINLGNDESNDVIRFAAGTDLDGIEISGANTNDVLWIGTTSYNYNSDGNGNDNGLHIGSSFWRQA